MPGRYEIPASSTYYGCSRLFVGRGLELGIVICWAAKEKLSGRLSTIGILPPCRAFWGGGDTPNILPRKIPRTGLHGPVYSLQ